MKAVCRACSPTFLVHKRSVSCSSCLYSRKRTKFPKFSFPSGAALRANIPITRKEKPDIYEGQVQRRKWGILFAFICLGNDSLLNELPYLDFPLGDDQKASWKHWRWYDPFFNKWVDLTPKPSRKMFDIYSKEKRTLIHEQDSIQMKFALLLDKDYKKKSIVPALNMDFITNLSYFYQYLTNTKFVHGIPCNVDSIDIKESAMEEFEQFLSTVLQLECHYNTNTRQEKSRKKRADRIISSIVHFFMNANASHPDFMDCTIDKDSQNAMFWQRGIGFHKYNLPDVPFTFQSHDAPLYQIRTKNRLQEFTPWMEDFMLTGDIPHSDLQPYMYGTKRAAYRNTIAPGFRHKGGDVSLNYHEALESGKLAELPPPIHDSCVFGHTQFISLPEKFSTDWYQANLEHCDITDQLEEHIKGHGIMSGWTWSASLAHYQGHWMDDDVQNPFCVQLYDIIEGTGDIRLHRDTVALLLKFMANSSKNLAKADDATIHNANLEVQHWDLDKPHIELQKPKHVRDHETALEVARQEELEKNKTWKDKVIQWVQR